MQSVPLPTAKRCIKKARNPLDRALDRALDRRFTFYIHIMTYVQYKV